MGRTGDAETELWEQKSDRQQNVKQLTSGRLYLHDSQRV